jgi:hypothetical protein
VRDSYLAKVRQFADRSGRIWPDPVVFEGNAPADIAENLPLRQLLHNPPPQPPAVGRIWLGAPNSIKGPTEAAFQPQSGNNLLIVGQREETVLSLFSVALISLTAQYSTGSMQLFLLDASAAGTPERDYLERLLQRLPHNVTVAKPGDVSRIMASMAAEMDRRTADVDAAGFPPVYLLIHDLQKFGRLRYEEDFGFSSSSDPAAEVNPASTFNKMLTEGTRLGFHVIASCDTYNNVNRFLSRKALSEFEMRVLFQMSANDSAGLIDSPKASMLGMHRALFFNAQEGYLETFRPYALPSAGWLATLPEARPSRDA